MQRTATLLILSAVGSFLAFAESWQGRLIDSACYEQQKNVATCDPTGSTTAFALIVSNKSYQLDDAGNAKAVRAFRDRADRSTDPAKPASSEVMAKITGTKDGDNILKVEMIELQ